MKLLKNLLAEMAMGRSRLSGPYSEAPPGYTIGNPVRATEIVAGMMLAATYNQYNHGTDFVKVLGFTDDDKKYGEGGVRFRSLRELFRAKGVRSLSELEQLQGRNEYGHHSYMVVQEINEDGTLGDSGPWYYPFEGRWVRGSGAEALSFRHLTKEGEGQVRSDRGLSGATIVFTGFRDPELARKAEQAGARIQNHITRQTKFVVALNPNSESGKAMKAREVGAQVISRQELESMLGQRQARHDFERMSMESVMEGDTTQYDSRLADELEEIKDQIKDLAEQALQIVRRSGNRMTYERAKAYWYPHIVMALDKEHGYMGGSMHSMEDSVRELREMDDENDPELADMDEDEREDYIAAKRRARRGDDRRM